MSEPEKVLGKIDFASGGIIPPKPGIIQHPEDRYNIQYLIQRMEKAERDVAERDYKIMQLTDALHSIKADVESLAASHSAHLNTIAARAGRLIVPI